MQIFVVGSKPNPHWPAVQPDVVILANGAIAYARDRFSAAHCIGFASLNFCRQSRGVQNRADRDAVEGVELDELVYWDPVGKDWLKDVNFKYKTGKELSNWEQWWFNYCHYSFVRWLVAIANPRNWWHAFKKHRVGMPAYFAGSRLSTGMLAVEYAMRRFPDADKIHVCGIGVKWTGGHFYDQAHAHDNFHEKADVALYRWIKKNRANVIFCEVGEPL
ncbi:hypothetical protein [Rhizobium sp. NRK18]|uniref:hypothetical protein n=1 Tax=Rhizobium sp. NRK18 TaxID=2964667 RepID=UPI0021C3D905|nr:hypothetical protein [Rhizobium sp. NRK18]MCQ2003651.1 hypothetical protein [Rhizobium sp. NRK18]